MKKNLLTKILWRKQSIWQFVFACIGLLVGLFVVLAALQLYVDVDFAINRKRQKLDKSEYLVLNKNIGLGNTFGLSKSGFSQSELRNIEDQPFVKAQGEFISNQFKVGASIPQLGFYSELFFEAVPDRFLDIQPDRWDWRQGDKEIPIITSREFLNLYNFGFAPSQSLPQLSPSTISKFTLNVFIEGNGKRDQYKARIVGFSDRISSILVPVRFMEYANKMYSEKPAQPSRVIIKVEDPSDPEVVKYLNKKGYQTDKDKLKLSQVGDAAKILISIVAVVGILFLILSLIIIIISYELIISKARDEIQLLIQLGYKPVTLSRQLIIFFLILLSSVMALVFAGLAYIIIAYLHPLFTDNGFQVTEGMSFMVILTGLVILITCLVLNAVTIQKNVLKQV